MTPSYEFPRGACEPANYRIWDDGSGSHPWSALVNLSIVSMISNQLMKHYRVLPKKMITLLCAEMIFEYIHGVCHLRHSAFADRCFDVQHWSGLLLVGALHSVVGLLTTSRSSITPVAVITADVLLTVYGAPSLYRALVAFFAFSSLLTQVVRAPTLKNNPTAYLAAALMLTSSTLFWAEGAYGCAHDALPHARFLGALGLEWVPPHVLFETIGFGVFATTNAALVQGLRKKPATA